ncbi:hypothetical protein [Sorangium sp. So ce1000]
MTLRRGRAPGARREVTRGRGRAPGARREVSIAEKFGCPILL